MKLNACHVFYFQILYFKKYIMIYFYFYVLQIKTKIQIDMPYFIMC